MDSDVRPWLAAVGAFRACGHGGRDGGGREQKREGGMEKDENDGRLGSS